MSAESTVKTAWEGDLPTGREETTVSSGTFAEFEVSWPARTERSTGTTSPEELLAVATREAEKPSSTGSAAHDGPCQSRRVRRSSREQMKAGIRTYISSGSPGIRYTPAP